MGLNYDDIKHLSPDAQAQILKQLGKAPKTSKYHAQKDERRGIRFDSKKEAHRYDELMLMLKAGEIRDLKLQAEYTLQEGFTTPEGQRIHAIRYRADFSYERKTKNGWVLVVEDTKGYRVDTYKLKKKMFREKYKFDITEV